MWTMLKKVIDRQEIFMDEDDPTNDTGRQLPATGRSDGCTRSQPGLAGGVPSLADVQCNDDDRRSRRRSSRRRSRSRRRRVAW